MKEHPNSVTPKELKQLLDVVGQHPHQNIYLQVDGIVLPLRSYLVDGEQNIILSSNPIGEDRKLQKVGVHEVPMKFNRKTQVVTVFLPRSESILSNFHTYKSTESEAFELVWRMFGDHVRDTLLDYGYQLDESKRV